MSGSNTQYLPTGLRAGVIIDKGKVVDKAGADAVRKGTWIEAVVDKNGSPVRVPSGALRIYFAGGAYCQIGNTAEVALAAELLGRLGAKR